MSRYSRRVHNWTLCRLLELRCVVIGHRYGRHFTDMGAASDHDHETPWCYRCGRDVPALLDALAERHRPAWRQAAPAAHLHLMAPIARDLYTQLIPVFDARPDVGEQALRVVCAAVRELHADATSFILGIDPMGSGFHLMSIITAEDVHAWKRPSGFGSSWRAPLDVLEYAPSLMQWLPMFEHAPTGAFWVDITKALDYLALKDEMAARELAHKANVVVKRFPLKPGVHDVKLGRAEIDTGTGWEADPAMFEVVVEGDRVFVDVTVHPLPRGDHRDVALTLGMFAPGADRGDLAAAPEGEYDRLTNLGAVTVRGVTYDLVAEYVED